MILEWKILDHLPPFMMALMFFTLAFMACHLFLCTGIFLHCVPTKA